MWVNPCHCVSPSPHPQKLGLSAGHLRKAFTSLSSTLTTLRTDAAAAAACGGGAGRGGAAGRDPLTLRSDIAETVRRDPLAATCTSINLPVQQSKTGMQDFSTALYGTVTLALPVWHFLMTLLGTKEPTDLHSIHIYEVLACVRVRRAPGSCTRT